MEMKQIATVLNTIAGEMFGKTDLVKDDLQGIVDLGTAVFDNNATDPYTKALMNQVGRVIFVNRRYNLQTPSVRMDGWRYGSVMQKISTDIPEAVENKSWELTNGQSYDPNIFTKPAAYQKFWNSRTTYEIDRSITDIQVRQSFRSAQDMQSFFGMLEMAVTNAMTANMQALILRTINNMTAKTLWEEYKNVGETAIEGLDTKSGVRAINLLFLYKQIAPTSTLTPETCVTDPEFIRFAAYTMGHMADRLTSMTQLYNIGGQKRFTPREDLLFITLSRFQRAADVYLQSDTYHNEFTRLPNAEVIPFWQGSKANSFVGDGDIHVVTSDNHEVHASAIVGVMFDRDCLGVVNYEPRVTSNYNAKAEFTNLFYKQDCGYFNDTNEQFVVFFVA